LSDYASAISHFGYDTTRHTHYLPKAAIFCHSRLSGIILLLRKTNQKDSGQAGVTQKPVMSISRANALCAISIHFPSCPKVFIGHPGAKELDSRLQTAGMTFPMLFFLIHNCFFV
jgi:hypothetical protein